MNTRKLTPTQRLEFYTGQLSNAWAGLFDAELDRNPDWIAIEKKKIRTAEAGIARARKSLSR